MARIELRNANIRLIDGHSNTGAVNGTLAVGNTTMGVDTLGTSGVIPVSSRFTVVGSGQTYTVTAQEAGAQISIDLDTSTSGSGSLTIAGAAATIAIAYDDAAADVLVSLNADANISAGDFTVTGSGTTADPFLVTATSTGAYGDMAVAMSFAVGTLDGSASGTQTYPGGATHSLTFTPAIKTGNVPADDAVITFTGRTLDIKVGEGNLTYTENKEFNYDLDRGNLDTVREGDQQPMDWTLDFTWEFLSAISGAVTPTIEEVFQKSGPAASWISSSDDTCEPFALDIEIDHVPLCSTDQAELIILPDARYESLEHNIQDATVSVSGRCNATRALKSRYTVV